MAGSDDNLVSMTVWCTLIPPEEIHEFEGREEGLRVVNEAYEDWLASMRKKAFAGTDAGVLLDRIRILMINIGIACALDREMAEHVQEVVSKHLRNRALGLVDEIKDNSSKSRAVKKTLLSFFRDLQFTRDIYPEEDLQNATPDKLEKSGRRFGFMGKVLASKSDVDKEEISKLALAESTNILKRLYMRLLSPDPWGLY